MNKQTGVVLSHGLEEPNPFKDLEMKPANMCHLTSYPISLQTQHSTNLNVSLFSVREFGSQIDLPSRALNSQLIRSYFAFFIGSSPFKPYTTYVVHFVGKATGGLAGDGIAIDKTWEFTTGTEVSYCQYY